MEEYKPLISIFVCSYNMEQYIEKCVVSLINQTYKNLEIILIDNGSDKDNTRSVNHALALKDKRIVLLDIDVNNNYGDALQKALDMAKGDFCYICDPDDYMPLDGFEKLVLRQNKDNSDIVCGSRYVVYEDRDDVDFDDCIDASLLKIKDNRIEYNSPLYKDLFFVDPCPHSKLYRTSIMKGMNVPKVTYTDNIFYFQALMNADVVSYDMNLCCSYYLCNRKGNITTTFKPYIIDAFSKMSEGLIKNGINSKHYNELKGIFTLREYLALKTWIDNSHNVLGDKEIIKKNMNYLYSTIMDFVLNNRKCLLKEVNNTNYYTFALYDKLLTSKLFSKIIYDNSINNILKEIKQ